MSSQEHKLLFYIFGQHLQVVKAATKKKKKIAVQLGTCYCSPRSLSKGLVLHDACRRTELGLWLDLRYVAAFSLILNLSASKALLSRVISGGGLLSLESKRGYGLLRLLVYTFLGDVPKEKYKCNAADVLDAVMLDRLWWQRGEIGFEIVVCKDWAFSVGRAEQQHRIPLGGRLSCLSSCISVFWGRDWQSSLRTQVCLDFCGNVMLLLIWEIQASERIKVWELLAHDLNPLIAASRKWRS